MPFQLQKGNERYLFFSVFPSSLEAHSSPSLGDGQLAMANFCVGAR